MTRSKAQASQRRMRSQVGGILRRRPSPALVVAVVALFISMGGVSYGLATGSIDSRVIKNNTIRTQDLRDNSLRGRDIRTGAVRSSDIGDNSMTGLDVLESSLETVPSATNANTAANANTANTASTASTANAAAKLANVTVQREDFVVPDNGGRGTVAVCPAGQQALTGGVVTGANDSYITNSRPGPEVPLLEDGQTFDRWFGFVFNQPGSSGEITSSVFVVCAS